MKQKDWDYSFQNSLTPWREEADIETLLEISQIKSGSALDLGCGTGEWAIALSDKGFEVEALDFSAEALKIAQSLSGAKKVNWVHWDLEQLAKYGFKTILYDLIIDHKVLAFIKDKEKYLDTVKKKLGGVYVLTVFHEHDKKGAINLSRDEFNQLVPQRFEIIHVQHVSPRPGKVLATYYLK